jgi:hypothetical protein
MQVLDDLRAIEADREREAAERYRLAVAAALNGEMSATEAAAIIGAAGKTVDAFAADMQALADARQLQADRHAAAVKVAGKPDVLASHAAVAERVKSRAIELDGEKRAWLAAHARRGAENQAELTAATALVTETDDARSFLLSTAPRELHERRVELLDQRAGAVGRIEGAERELRDVNKVADQPVPERPDGPMWRCYSAQEQSDFWARRQRVINAQARAKSLRDTIASSRAEVDRLDADLAAIDAEMLIP